MRTLSQLLSSCNSQVLGSCLAACVLLLGAVDAAIASDEQAPRPNILVILCDDLGYGDLSCFGHPHIQTPNLDRLADGGIRFTDCYSAAPVCSPSRVGLLTGRNPNRAGIYDWIPHGHSMHLVAEERTIANMLRDAGYDTGLFGKWHCNGVFNKPEQPQPDHHGFDYWFATQNNAAPSHENPTNFVRNGQAVGPQIGFSCQIVAKEASQWISNREDRSKPFFSFVCFHEPHEPVASPEDLVERYSLVAKNRDEAQYFANVENMDAAIGDLMRTLEQLEIADNTLVFFTSDNGPETLNRYKTANRSYGTPGSLRGMKLWVYEGGIRVPGIAHWPKGIAPGQIIHEPVCSVDLLPTLATLSGARLETNRSLDGTDLAGLLTSSAKVERQTPLYWFYYRAYPQPKAALRDGDWMVLGHWDGPHLGPGGSVQQGDVDLIKKHNLAKFELYNVREDPSQSHDLANSEPQLLQRMARMLSDKYIEIRSETRQWTE